ncbi:adenylate kinase + 3-isopropylmalate dehydratase, small subunit (modular protein) [Verrucomicrobia bacterium]|nr:adenylate kinase + 3-isopropylmalate dehydratase, small subunit (modular protein) [Verrucomicrobiota bacterium]
MPIVVYRTGDDVSTDVIYPGRFMATVLPTETPQFAFADDAAFNAKLKAKQILPGSAIVGGQNFGCGSSREQAVSCLKGYDLLILARGFARIFLQNAINLGLRLVVCPGIEAAVGDELELNNGEVINTTSGRRFPITPMPVARQAIADAGGLIAYTRNRLLKAARAPKAEAWIKGGDARCAVEPKPVAQPLRVVLLGAPGVGKGTQAELLSARFGACQLSTGDIFRAAKTLQECERTPAMTAALGYMKRGALVPDETVVALVAERSGCLRCGGGFLLDGFPRTVAQAEELDRVLAAQQVELGAVLSYELPIERIVARLSGRRTCAKCKAVFHIEARPPKQAGICDHCGAELQQREDDRPEAVRVRMEAYEQSTAPLAEFYRRRGLLVRIAAEGTPEDIFERTAAALEEVKKNTLKERKPGIPA